LFLLLKIYLHTFFFHRGHGYLKKERERKKRKESLSTNAHEFSSLQKKRREKYEIAMLPGRKREEEIRRKDIIYHFIHPHILV